MSHTYRVLHTTEYDYAERVPQCHNVLRLRPRATPRQRLLEYELDILPREGELRHHEDVFGNTATYLSVQEPHQLLVISARSVVEVSAPPPLDLAATPPWEQVVAMLDDRRNDYTLDARSFCFDSPYVPRHRDLADYARPDFTPGTPVGLALLALTRRIHDEFTFDPGATSVGTPVLKVLDDRRGVCQD